MLPCDLLNGDTKSKPVLNFQHSAQTFRALRVRIQGEKLDTELLALVPSRTQEQVRGLGQMVSHLPALPTKAACTLSLLEVLLSQQ